MITFGLNFNLFNNYYYIYERLIVIFASLFPSLLLVAFVLYTDRKRKEPVKNIIICLLSGILTVSLAGYLEELVAPFFASNTVLTYLWAGLEEISKMAIFFLFIFDNKHYDDIYDGVVYMTLIALSFAGLENLLYAFSESTVSDSISLAIMRDFTTIPLHVICGIVIGYLLSLASFSKDKGKKTLNMLYAVLFSTLIHGTYNFLMGVLGDVRVNYNNKVEVLLFQTLPLLIIIAVLFVIAVKVIKKAVYLDNIYVENKGYDEKHKYLMTYDEYIESSAMKNRMKMYLKTSLKRKNKDFKSKGEN